MNKLMETVHPGEDHVLAFEEGWEITLSLRCHKCMQPAVSRDYYICKRGYCGYYLHKECIELKDLPRKQHPLHPQHPLVEHFSYSCDKSFVCSFCGETKQSRRFYQCSEDQCDFYLDTTCAIDFTKRPELLVKYEIQHVLHHHENHRLSPYITRREQLDWCAGCKHGIFKDSAGLCYKCIACRFYLHTECAQVPKEEVQHHSHPQHTLVLLENPPPPAALHDHSNDEVRCAACLKWIKGEFYLHCNHCPTFNLDLHCYFRFKPTLKHEAHHEHPLAFFEEIYDDDVRCYACNTPCNYDSFRCFTCNFNIHSGCHALPITHNYYDHVHPLILTTSFGDDEDPTTYYCYICDESRDPDHGIYLCKESKGCSFLAHFECALSLSTEEEAEYADAPWRQKLKVDEEEDMRLSSNENVCALEILDQLRLSSNEKVCALEILDQLNGEIKKVREVIGQIFINKKEKREQLTEKLQNQFKERHTNTEDMLRRLKQSVRETNSN